MRKSESLQMLDLLGLNTIEYFVTKDKREATHYLAKHMGGKRSMRTERGDQFLCPFYYNIPGEELLPKALQHIDEGFTLIFSNSLDGNDTQMFGTIALTGGLDDHAEIVVGPGKVRELDTHPNKQHIKFNPGSVAPIVHVDPWVRREIWYLYEVVKAACVDQVPCILEWSRYPYRVGQLQKYFIFWELRGYEKN